MSGPLDETADARAGRADKLALAAGDFLGKYRLDRVLGEGGMGVVWAAHDPDLDRAIAIKVLRYAQASQELRQRLLREARAMAKLKHPNVLTVYEVGTVGDRDYIAMELVDGMTLDAWLALGPTHDEIWSAVLAAGRGLAAAHEAGVVHRDFKPHNVLRSRGGRILVTDFGLARGMLAEGESASTGEPRLDGDVTPFDETLKPLGRPSLTGDSVLDSPLTQTGALIGTPAYMAPEQYMGAPPDPRTDQFAFCVTAWQALTGERPFKGGSLDEMRTSVGGGVGHITVKLPRGVRNVLSRGLDPAAKERWPSMEELLDALEHAGGQPERRRRLVVTSLAIAASLIAFGVVLVLSRARERDKTGCDDPDAQFVEAWSPALKSELARKASPEAAARIGEQLDRYASQWIETYARACRVRPAKVSRQRIDCLEGVRDRMSAITGIMRELDPRMLDRFDPRDPAPPVTTCESTSPLAPPRVAAEQPRRGQIIAMIGKSFTLRGMPTDQLGAKLDAMLAEAAPLGWEPYASIALVAAANQYTRAGEPSLARDTFKRALEALPKQAELRDVRLEGAAYLGLLETSLDELENPRAPAARPRNDDRLKSGVSIPSDEAPLHGELAMRITKATNATKGDPMLLASRSLLAALAYAAAAQWNLYQGGYDEALELTAEARKLYDEIGDVERSAQTAYVEAQIYLQRGDARALDDALFAARRGQDALAAAKLALHPGLERVRAQVAFARRDWTELYRALRAAGPNEPAPTRAPLVKGRVVGDMAGIATVVAWKGDAVGHPRAIVMSPRELVGEIVRAERDGSFAIHAEPGWAIMAEWLDARSTPQLVGTGPVTLKLEPTVTVSGRIDGKNWFGVKAFARYSIGENHWILETPVDGEGAFDLRGLPAGARVYGVEGPAGNATRTIVAGVAPKGLTWSYGPGIEAIVRAKQIDDDARVWIVRGAHTPATRADLEALAVKAADVATATLGRIGADNTDVGRELYRAGDRHAVITGNYSDNPYTACVTPTRDAPVACKTISVEAGRTLELSDGRYAATVTPILFEL